MTLKMLIECLARQKEGVFFNENLSIWCDFNKYIDFCSDNIFPELDVNIEFYNTLKQMFYTLNCEEQLCYVDTDKWLALFKSKAVAIIPAYAKQYEIISHIKEDMLKQETIAEGTGNAHNLSKSLASNTPQKVLNAKTLEDVNYMSNGGISEGDSSSTQSSKTYTNNILPQIKTMEEATTRQSYIIEECCRAFNSLFMVCF